MPSTYIRVADGRRSLILVVFIGGVTFAEISALRFLSSQEGMVHDIIVGTTKIVNGHTLIETFMEEGSPSSVRYTMLQLFLSEPKWIDCNANDESAKQRKSLLSELESVIQSLLSSGGRSEARLWLCNTLSGISSISLHRQHELFLSLLTSKPTKQHLAAQLLQLIFDKKPQKVGPIIAKKSYTLQDFFRGK
ncbi:unnamed protein product [Fraxinus pennsylvanica]|uniref:Uncharacterized protein n=1 Tax=Fraxinus pennsylvanica TaxID=56036 RepID=A0AAD2DPZ8_9LAMI|nr:unnamed protein product [Fraxinus pennsylvanica]